MVTTEGRVRIGDVVNQRGNIVRVVMTWKLSSTTGVCGGVDSMGTSRLEAGPQWKLAKEYRLVTNEFASRRAHKWVAGHLSLRVQCWGWLSMQMLWESSVRVNGETAQSIRRKQIKRAKVSKSRERAPAAHGRKQKTQCNT